jgi:hypothetical protein
VSSVVLEEEFEENSSSSESSVSSLPSTAALRITNAPSLPPPLSLPSRLARLFLHDFDDGNEDDFFVKKHRVVVVVVVILFRLSSTL